MTKMYEEKNLLHLISLLIEPYISFAVYFSYYSIFMESFKHDYTYKLFRNNYIILLILFHIYVSHQN